MLYFRAPARESRALVHILRPFNCTWAASPRGTKMCATKTTSAQTLWQPSKTILTILLFVSLNSDFATLSCSARVHQQHELSVGKEQQCQSHNQRLSNFLRDRLDEVRAVRRSLQHFLLLQHPGLHGRQESMPSLLGLHYWLVCAG